MTEDGTLLTTFSHELRTPLTSLKTSLAILARSDLGERERQLLEVSQRNVERLIELVANLVDTAGLAAGTLDLELREEDPDELMAAAVAAVRDRTGRDDVAVASPAGGGGTTVAVDRALLLRVLCELLNNAVKFSKPGSGVDASVAATKGGVEFRVTDHGRGLSDDERAMLFEPFGQLDKSLTRDAGGLGLGLALCKGVVERHGGRLQVASQLGRGSSLWFRLPAGTGRAAADVAQER